VTGRPPTILVAVALALAITALWWQLAERRARIAEARLATAEARIGAIEDSLRSAGPGATHGPDARAAAIIADLVRHPELIPFDGLEGGTMRFYPAQSSVIAPGWAYGYFEDGHIAGHGLFEYQAGPDGKIRWKRLAAKLE
jgi:hypothetical protein